MIKVFIICTVISFALAFAGVLTNQKYRQYFVSASYIAICIPPIHGIFDIVSRINAGNVASVTLNYPMMGKRYICMLLLVTVIHMIKLNENRSKK